MSKYSIIAYTLWLTLGWLGGHLFYLGRDHQGILWLTSFGGLFGVGWFRDLYRIPTYVKEANGEDDFLWQRWTEIRRCRRPSIWHRSHLLIAQVLFGLFYRTLIFYSLPEEYARVGYIVTSLVPLGTALGAYMVSNNGSIKCSWKYSLVGAYLGEICFGNPHLIVEGSYPSLAASVCTVFSTFSWQYNRTPRVVVTQSRCVGTCKRLLLWALCAILFFFLLCSAIYFNGSVQSEDGEVVKIRVAMSNFFRSPHWQQLKDSFWKSLEDLWRDFKTEGLEGVKKRLIMYSDIQGEERSRLILGVKQDASLKELKDRYRELAKEWHPDHHHSSSEQEKEFVTEKFVEINDAYNNLVSITKRKSKGFFRR